MLYRCTVMFSHQNKEVVDASDSSAPQPKVRIAGDLDIDVARSTTTLNCYCTA